MKDRYYDAPLSLQPWLALADLLASTAHESVRVLRQARRKGAYARPSKGATLRPGPGTPLWNKLACLAAEQIGRKYGDKAALGRVLGVPRQRVHDYLIAKTACPDTERALRLLVWLGTRLTVSDQDASRPQCRTSRSA